MKCRLTLDGAFTMAVGQIRQDPWWCVRGCEASWSKPFTTAIQSLHTYAAVQHCVCGGAYRGAL